MSWCTCDDIRRQCLRVWYEGGRKAGEAEDGFIFILLALHLPLDTSPRPYRPRNNFGVSYIHPFFFSFHTSEHEHNDDEAPHSTLDATTLGIIADALLGSKGLSVSVNGSPWQRVLIRLHDLLDEAVIIIYGLMPGRHYDIDLGLIQRGQAGSICRQVVTEVDAALKSEIEALNRASEKAGTAEAKGKEDVDRIRKELEGEVLGLRKQLRDKAEECEGSTEGGCQGLQGARSERGGKVGSHWHADAADPTDIASSVSETPATHANDISNGAGWWTRTFQFLHRQYTLSCYQLSIYPFHKFPTLLSKNSHSIPFDELLVHPDPLPL
ncbi:hypothetical protein K503DRAFT_858772 [Rhizopogon vinicolor AM-OR11-026]|uniref:Uncharacterized protein n=1 Tax=Rhizopogon vinicolor AM-OR11-026 TaxID=1314800 RepID=A0A1B7MRD7_9AGAM|nr:hypothetical protein K503DRAFT_858772 [Rhizopogon vinicolor AM-OR11-026]